MRRVCINHVMGTKICFKIWLAWGLSYGKSWGVVCGSCNFSNVGNPKVKRWHTQTLKQSRLISISPIYVGHVIKNANVLTWWWSYVWSPGKWLHVHVISVIKKCSRLCTCTFECESAQRRAPLYHSTQQLVDLSSLFASDRHSDTAIGLMGLWPKVEGHALHMKVQLNSLRIF